MSRPQRILYEVCILSSQLTETEHKAEQYQCFMANEELDKKLIKFYNEQALPPILGDDLFINLLTLVKSSTEIPRHSQVYARPAIAAVILEVALLFEEEVSAITTVKKGRVKSNTPRKMAMYIARKYGDYRFQELADAFGLQHYGGASYAVYAFAQELQRAPELGKFVKRVVKQLGIFI